MSINKVPFFRFLLVFLSIIAFMALVWQGTSKAIIEESKEEKTASYFDEVFLCGFQDSFQKIRLFETSPKSYEVYMPGEMRTDVRVEFDGFEKIQIGSVSYCSGEELTDIYQPETYTMRAIDSKGNVLEEAKVHFYFSVFVPSVYIESEIGSMEILNSQKGLKGNAGFTVITEEGKKDVSGKCSIKTRGNTSFQVDQKSYSLNLMSEQEILGMSACSEWTLLANYKNTTHQMKNKMVLDLAALMGMEFTPESRFVNVYLDHQYQGLYLMTQKVSADGGSVKFSEENKADAVSGPYLMEMDERFQEEPVWIETETRNFVLKYPKNIDVEQKEYVSNYMKMIENVLFSGKDYGNCLDLKSWVRMYLLQEFFVQSDVEFSSFFVYKKNGDPHLYSGPVWDFDLAFGEIFWGYYPRLTQRTLFIRDDQGGWLAELEKSIGFSNALKKVYREDFVPLLETYLEQNFEEQISRLASSSFMNSKRWGRGDSDLMTDAEELRLWITGRKDFLYQYLEDETQFQKIVFQFGWGPMSYYVKKGEKIGFLPCEEYGEIDYSEKTRNGYGTIIGWQEQSGQMVTEDFVVTKDEFFYPVYKE